jgi:nucleoside-diphosphate-sugar epimerase
MQGVHYVFHLAAMISVPESMQKPAECKEINSHGTLVVLEEAAKAGARKLILSSSSAVYGDNAVMPKVESMAPEAKSPYAVSKLEGESCCQKFADEGKVQTVCLRCFNVFGPRQDPAGPYAAAVPNFIRQALRHEPITIYGDGEQTRDFIFVSDVAAANAFFATHSPATGVFNVASGRSITINELAKTICRLTNSRSEIKHAPERAGDVKHSAASVDRMHAEGFKPTGNLLDGLQATIEFFRKRS